ncbi:MAG: multiple monosaccharide ABC transporter permease [Cetobacterium sp.]|uniref:multiple monosaccharide ABC transporter permease n=1 Tax=unclassified Cetobacterium TaxID=2630983 RepID=UPI0006475954|nr:MULTISPECIES: multiple monosaccharide ABC transporter permease [unclassified Cetobacterium]
MEALVKKNKKMENSEEVNIKKEFNLKNGIRKYGMLIALAVIMVLFAILTDGISLRPLNITNLILQNSYILILAIGMLLVIITGNIDLSVGSVAAFIGAIAGYMMITLNMNYIVAIIISIGVGALIGALQGAIIAYIKVPAFIVTLGGMLVFRGLTMVTLQGRSLAPFPDGLRALSSNFIVDIFSGVSLHMTTILIGVVFSILYIIVEFKKRGDKVRYNLSVENINVFAIKMLMVALMINLFTYTLAAYKGVPTILVVLSILTILYSYITRKTIFGRHIYAIGGNEKAAKLSGIKTKKVLLMVYVNMGILAAISGIAFAARLNAATPKAGNGFELDAIAACYIGGASASGGVGTIIGAIIGGLVMGVMNNGMSILGVGIDWQQAIKGIVLVLAVIFDIYTKSGNNETK